jgi:hypothetical protein
MSGDHDEPQTTTVDPRPRRLVRARSSIERRAMEALTRLRRASAADRLVTVALRRRAPRVRGR